MADTMVFACRARHRRYHSGARAANLRGIGSGGILRAMQNDKMASDGRRPGNGGGGFPPIRRFAVGAFDENAYLVDCGDGIAALVDPGADAAHLAEAVRSSGLRLAAVLLTHGHIDHVSAVPALLSAFPGVPVRLAQADSAWCWTMRNYFPPYEPVLAPPATLLPVADGDVFAVGLVRFRVLATPGHSPGSVCYAASFARDNGGREVLFSGDTLFAASVGRTDFEGGDPAAMTRSLRRLADLAPDTPVLPGHGPATTIARETAGNPWVVQALAAAAANDGTSAAETP